MAIVRRRPGRSQGAGRRGASAYDEIAYPTHATAAAHPDRLATIATLMGLRPAPVTSCRTLELGCGSGGNLIAMAAHLPEATFVGCDLAAQPIASARELVARLGLPNVTLLQRDLREVPAEFGEFDYIIAHGVYSWVPAEVREAMLDLIARRLAPQGVALVSYNTYPGCHLRRMAWEILRFHVEGIGEPGRRLAEARALVALMADPGNAEEPINLGLRQEFRELARRPDPVLFHDDLAPINDPCYFHEFVAKALDHGLDFLGEAEYHMMGDAGVAPAVRQVLAGMDRLAREQYLDFVRGRRFRQTLLCRTGLAPARALVPERLAGLWALAPKFVTDGRVAFPAPEPAGAPVQSGAAADEPLAADASAVLRDIATAWPRPIAVAELAQRHRARAGAAESDAAVPRRLAEILFGAYGAGVIELHSHVPRLPEAAGALPTASALARAQLAQGDPVVNPWHENIVLDDALGRQLLPLLDGTRDRAALLAALGPEFRARDVEDPAEQLERYLRHYTRLALLVG